MMIFFYLILGILPSAIWLSFFLREDAHPESNRMIMKVFLCGIAAAIIAVIFEWGFKTGFSSLFLPFPVIRVILTLFIGVALIEEISKYIVVRKIAIADPEFDEPLDAMLYMVIVGLGFAAVENIFLLIGQSQSILSTLILTILRFVGATFLHALCSGIVGFFLAFSFFYTRKRLLLTTSGIALATALHGIYNFSIMKFEGDLKISVPAILLLGMGIFVFLAFQKLKTIKSTCRIK